MLTYRSHACKLACKLACASARMVKHSIIFGRILFKFDVHILQMTTNYMGYILSMFKHRVHACKWAYASVRVLARMIKRTLIFERILSKFGGEIQ
jgi:hypothetical protein